MKRSWNPVRSGRTKRTLAFALLGLWLGLSLMPGRAAAGPDGAGPAAYAEACRTYENRARFLPRDGRLDFVVLLAEGCRAARRSLDADDAAERAAARRLLEGIRRLRRTVIAMNMDMAYDGRQRGVARPGAGHRRMRAFRSVSRAGEFLIAHSMGLVGALDAYRAHARGVPVARR